MPGRFCVGFVGRAHGIRGELFLNLFAGRADWLGKANKFTLLKPRQSAAEERSIDHATPHKDGVILGLAGIATRDAAEDYRGSFVYVADDLLVAPAGEGMFLRQIEGFGVVDSVLGPIGEIVGFSSNGSQDLLRVRAAGGEALIPLVPEFLIDIDFDRREVRVGLPPGLLELN